MAQEAEGCCHRNGLIKIPDRISEDRREAVFLFAPLYSDVHREPSVGLSTACIEIKSKSAAPHRGSSRRPGNHKTAWCGSWYGSPSWRPACGH